VRDDLLEKIELLRLQMVKTGLEYGLDHPDVLKYSKMIDELHNELMELDLSLAKTGRKKKSYRFYILENTANFA